VKSLPLRLALALLIASTSHANASPSESGLQRDLVVCADPNNLPFSNRTGEGFENEIAELVARNLGTRVRYVWWAQRRGFARHTLDDAACDVWPGIATASDSTATTASYYRSTYVFVSRAGEALQGLTLDDPRLRSLSLGVQMVGNDAMNTPPAHALARRGLTQNVHGYMLYGNYEQPNPPAAIIDAVSRGDIDVALVWGPLAGFFAARSTIPLRLEPVTPAIDDARWPMTFDISMGVRRSDTELHRRIESVLALQKPAIDRILDRYHVPRS
jgi:quinoprotein dehydrogenase-associated probable ABC transporter substrate-binding protein